MNDEKATIQIHIADQESLARGLQVMVDKINEASRAVSTLATVLGFTIAAVDRSQSPNLTLTDALLRALDCADQSGLAGPIVENLRNALLTGSSLTPPPDHGTFLKLIRGGVKAA